MSPLRVFLAVAVLVAACLGAAAADQPGSGEGYTIAGRIKIDALLLGEAMSTVITKFSFTSMLMWMVPVAIMYGFNHQIFPDPEEIKQAQEQMRNSPVPSFSGLLARANS